MKLVCISDTHGYLPNNLPIGDVLIHCGDATARGTQAQHYQFVEWLDAQPHHRKIFISGNHDLYSESCYIDDQEQLVYPMKMRATRPRYLRDQAYTNASGVKFYGTPWTPEFNDWAFMYKNIRQGHDHFSKIPEGTDVLIVHGPPYGILDQCPNPSGKGQKKVGSKELVYHINRVKPKMVVFGHIHEQGGKQVEKDGILYVNAAYCTGAYEPLNPVQVIDLDI
jgi:Icc-related predicted phosphoesterase